MTSTAAEVTAGSIVRLDTDALRARGDCQTNAAIGPEGDRAVVGTHDFLVVRVNTATNVCTAVPLFSKSAVGNQPLSDELKSGAADGWIGTEVFFSRWQHWRIPSAHVREALANAAAPHDSRAVAPRRYAVTDGAALDDIRAWESRNRAAYRPA